MIKHAMDVTKAATTFLNSTQCPVITCDQPLFALAIKIQWLFPSMYGEDQFVTMLGSFHIEMSAMAVLGDILDGTGWVEVISEAGVTTLGVAKSFIKVSHLMRTRNAHQITLLALHKLKMEAWDEYLESSTGTKMIRNCIE